MDISGISSKLLSAEELTKKPNNTPTFLTQLVRMLRDQSMVDVIEWTNDGILDVKEPVTLTEKVLPEYFKHSNYSSFQRQLNYFGFKKKTGKGKLIPCTYSNDYASKDVESLLKIKRRTGLKRSFVSHKQSSSLSSTCASYGSVNDDKDTKKRIKTHRSSSKISDNVNSTAAVESSSYLPVATLEQQQQSMFDNRFFQPLSHQIDTYSDNNLMNVRNLQTSTLFDSLTGFPKQQQFDQVGLFPLAAATSTLNEQVTWNSNSSSVPKHLQLSQLQQSFDHKQQQKQQQLSVSPSLKYNNQIYGETFDYSGALQQLQQSIQPPQYFRHQNYIGIIKNNDNNLSSAGTSALLKVSSPSQSNVLSSHTSSQYPFGKSSTYAGDNESRSIQYSAGTYDQLRPTVFGSTNGTSPSLHLQSINNDKPDTTMPLPSYSLQKEQSSLNEITAKTNKNNNSSSISNKTNSQKAIERIDSQPSLLAAYNNMVASSSDVIASYRQRLQQEPDYHQPHQSKSSVNFESSSSSNFASHQDLMELLEQVPEK